ncbi:tripartite motif-containing protein 60-like [Pipistrellus kuhlii]|uniref:tripartite motif-containing protein 60-like n=1 Tax=Pipistrellus kuhlii TaxID=59472 RepID=UPI00174F7A6E|nr:tripartite motif-containing protein 60-like [Pipistrellus kuhlii]
MESAALVAEFQEEASCPICLDHLTDPVTIACGHNFCPSCIQQCWEGLQGTFPCPVCLHHCPDRSLKRNPQLCHVMEIAQQMPTVRVKRRRQEEPLCKKHREVLALFCEKDLELLCARCRVSPDHRNHPLKPIEEAAATQRRKLKSCIESLSKQIKDTENRSEMQEPECLELRQRIENQKDELQTELKQLKHFLEEKQMETLTSLLAKETKVQEKLIEEKNQISNHRSTLNSLLRDMISKCVQTDVDFLTGIERIHNRYENLETPAIFSHELEKESFELPPNYLGLHKMIRTFHEDLTLDPGTAHPSLTILENRKSVAYGTSFGCRNLQAFSSFAAVLSSEGFDAGRHFWQVEIGGTGVWSLGVCKESLPRDALMSPFLVNGCWKLQRWGNTSVTCHLVNWERIGIFLDYELGEVSFYNLRKRSHLCTFRERFTGKLRPYFCLGHSSKSLVMRIAEDE